MRANVTKLERDMNTESRITSWNTATLTHASFYINTNVRICAKLASSVGRRFATSDEIGKCSLTCTMCVLACTGAQASTHASKQQYMHRHTQTQTIVQSSTNVSITQVLPKSASCALQTTRGAADSNGALRRLTQSFCSCVALYWHVAWIQTVLFVVWVYMLRSGLVYLYI